MLSPNLKETIGQRRAQYSELPIQWRNNNDLHVTLILPWHEEDIAGVINILQTSGSLVQPFRFRLNQTTFELAARKPSLIWRGQTTSEMLTLKTYLEKLLKRKPASVKNFPHVTLGHFQRKEFKKLPKTLAQPLVWNEYIFAFSLVETYITHKGATYKVLVEIPLEFTE